MARLGSQAALGAALALLGCAGGDAALRRDVEALQSELLALRAQNEALSRKVDGVSARMDLVAARARAPESTAAAATEPRASAPIVPPDLAVVRMAPPAARRGGTPPPLPTHVPIVEPDAARLDELARKSGRELAAEASAGLRAARRRTGLDLAHALEDFAARYPRHPEADNALVDAAGAYAGEDRTEAACALARRAAADYPAGDAMSDTLERLAWCESRRGASDAELRLLERLVTEYPSTPAAQRAGPRLAEAKRSIP